MPCSHRLRLLSQHKQAQQVLVVVVVVARCYRPEGLVCLRLLPRFTRRRPHLRGHYSSGVVMMVLWAKQGPKQLQLLQQQRRRV